MMKLLTLTIVRISFKEKHMYDDTIETFGESQPAPRQTAWNPKVFMAQSWFLVRAVSGLLKRVEALETQTNKTQTSKTKNEK